MSLDGGDMRYVTRDICLVAMETGASPNGIVAGIILLRRRRTGALSADQLLILLALMVMDF